MQHNDRPYGMRDGGLHSQSWTHVLEHAAPRDHIVQLYQDQSFLNRAVCRFAAATLTAGEGLILVPTLAHWNAIRPRLEAEGVNVADAQSRGQLTIVDADEFLPRFLQNAMPATPIFLGLPGAIIPRPSSDYPLVGYACFRSFFFRL